MKQIIRGFISRFPTRLRDRRFWVIQLIVIAISAAHTWLEATRHLGELPDLGLLPVSTYFIPVIYAALNFGIEGALGTAMWSCLLTVPNIILWHTPPQRPGVVLQLLILAAIGYVVARRVDFEAAAKRRAEAANTRLEVAQQALEEYVRLATDAQEEERKRLARELHDDTIQTLVISKAELNALAAETPLPAPAGARLKSVEDTLASAIDNIRRFSRDLRPSLLDDLGLVHAVDWLVGDIGMRTEINASLRTTGEPRRLHQKDELAVFRIVQEALRNVERHAQATAVEVGIDFGDGVRATVTDDGRGFDTSREYKDRRANGLGLLGMRERAKLAGASLEIESARGVGTSVSVVLSGANRNGSLPSADRPEAPGGPRRVISPS